MYDHAMLLTSFLCGFFYFMFTRVCVILNFDDRGDAVHVHSILSTNGMEVSHFFESIYRCLIVSLNWFLLVHNNRVIVYDRFGMHEKEVKSLLKLPGVDYYPFTG